MSDSIHDGPLPDAAAKMTFKALLLSDQARAVIEPMLPEGQTYERIVREAINAKADNPDIALCEPESIIRAVSRAVSWDLEIGNTAFLVPRKDNKSDEQPKLRAQLGYRGKIVLMSKPRGTAILVDAMAVYQEEHFRYEQGTNPFIEHRPKYDVKARGPMVAAYAYAKFGPYAQKIVVMSVDEIRAIQEKFSFQWKGRRLEDIPWYAEARCVHRLARQVPLTGKARLILSESDDADIEDADAIEEPPPARQLGEGAAQPVKTPMAEAVRQAQGSR